MATPFGRGLTYGKGGRRVLAFVLALVTGSTPALATPRTSLFQVVSRDAGYMFHSYRSLTGRDLLSLGAYSLFVGGLAANKREVNRGVRILMGADRNRNGGTFSGFKFLGDSGVSAGIGAMFLVGGLEAESEREVETGIMILESYFFSGVFTAIGQFVLAEQRPYLGGEMRFFTGDGHGVSGHSALAACLVCPLTHQYLKRDPADGRGRTVMKELLRITAWGLPLMTGLSRVGSDEHYVWNVALGLAVGYGTGHMIARSHESASHPDTGSTTRDRITWSPFDVSYSF